MTPQGYIEAVWGTFIPGAPLVDVANVEVDADSLPSPWVGMLVQAEPSRLVTLGSKPYGEETGVVLLGVFTKSGTGADAGTAVAYQIRDAFLGYQDPERQFEVRTINGPMNLDPDADGGWFRMAVELEYGLWLKGQN